MKEPGKELPPNPAEVAAFGFGRRSATYLTVVISLKYSSRVCPGRFLALNSSWLAIVSLLSSFNIERAVDSQGKEIIPEPLYTDGHIRSVRAYPAYI
jgi:hypothetical protein